MAVGTSPFNTEITESTEELSSVVCHARGGGHPAGVASVRESRLRGNDSLGRAFTSNFSVLSVSSVVNPPL